MDTSGLFLFGDRRSGAAFWLGSLIITIGVGLHLPMFLMARDMGYMLAGMPMDSGMLVGMGLIMLGVLVAGYGLLPKTIMPLNREGMLVTLAPPEDAPLTGAHWR
jgi:putative MFS transporter